MTELSRERSGKPALDETISWATRQYRSHLELVYPLGLFGLLSLLLEIRVELVWALFNLDGVFGIEADADLLEGLLSEPVAEALAPVLEELFILFVLGIVGLFFLVALSFFFAIGIAFLVADDELAGVDRSQSARVRVTIRRLPAVLGASILAIPLIVLSSLFLIFPGVYLFVRFALGAPAIIVDGYGPIGGLRTSWRRTKGKFSEVFAVAVVGMLVIGLVGFVPVIGELVSIFVLLPVVALTLGVLYADSG